MQKIFKFIDSKLTKYRNFVYSKWFRVLFLILAISFFVFECWDIFSYNPSGWQKQFAVVIIAWGVYLITHGIFSLKDKSFMSIYASAAMFVIFVITIIIAGVLAIFASSIIGITVVSIIFWFLQMIFYGESHGEVEDIGKGS